MKFSIEITYISIMDPDFAVSSFKMNRDPAWLKLRIKTTNSLVELPDRVHLKKIVNCLKWKYREPYRI
jgi:hypothetical protein